MLEKLIPVIIIIKVQNDAHSGVWDKLLPAAFGAIAALLTATITLIVNNRMAQHREETKARRDDFKSIFVSRVDGALKKFEELQNKLTDLKDLPDGEIVLKDFNEIIRVASHAQQRLSSSLRSISDHYLDGEGWSSLGAEQYDKLVECLVGLEEMKNTAERRSPSGEISVAMKLIESLEVAVNHKIANKMRNI